MTLKCLWGRRQQREKRYGFAIEAHTWHEHRSNANKGWVRGKVIRKKRPTAPRYLSIQNDRCCRDRVTRSGQLYNTRRDSWTISLTRQAEDERTLVTFQFLIETVIRTLNHISSGATLMKLWTQGFKRGCCCGYCDCPWLIILGWATSSKFHLVDMLLKSNVLKMLHCIYF